MRPRPPPVRLALSSAGQLRARDATGHQELAPSGVAARKQSPGREVGRTQLDTQAPRTMSDGGRH